MGFRDEVFGRGDAPDSLVFHFHDFAGDFVGGERFLRLYRRDAFLFPRIGRIFGIEVRHLHRSGRDGQFAQCADFRHAFGRDDDDFGPLHLQLAQLALPLEENPLLRQLRLRIYLVRRRYNIP